jgi:hypothetical protein
MRTLLIALIMAPAMASAQKVALIDEQMKLPMLFTDSVSVQQVKARYFAVDVAGIDTFYANLSALDRMLEKEQRAKFESFEFHSGRTAMIIKRHPMAFGDRYDIMIVSNFNGITSEVMLSEAKESNSALQHRIRRMQEYMKKNKDVFRSANDIQPRMYNVVVFH